MLQFKELPAAISILTPAYVSVKEAHAVGDRDYITQEAEHTRAQIILYFPPDLVDFLFSQFPHYSLLKVLLAPTVKLKAVDHQVALEQCNVKPEEHNRARIGQQ